MKATLRSPSIGEGRLVLLAGLFFLPLFSSLLPCPAEISARTPGPFSVLQLHCMSLHPVSLWWPLCSILMSRENIASALNIVHIIWCYSLQACHPMGSQGHYLFWICYSSYPFVREMKVFSNAYPKSLCQLSTIMTDTRENSLFLLIVMGV